MSAVKDHIIFTSPENEADFEETKDSSPIGADVGEAVGPGGEIDWDCPCLQGMTDGPCGDAFKEAFSCFVYSQEEQKGSECLEQFKAMQDCLVANAEYYGMNNGDGDAAAPAEAVADNVSETVTEVASEAAEAVSEAVEAVSEVVESVPEAVSEAVAEVSEAASKVAADVAEVAADVADAVVDAVTPQNQDDKTADSN